MLFHEAVAGAPPRKMQNFGPPVQDRLRRRRPADVGKHSMGHSGESNYHDAHLKKGHIRRVRADVVTGSKVPSRDIQTCVHQ